MGVRGLFFLFLHQIMYSEIEFTQFFYIQWWPAIKQAQQFLNDVYPAAFGLWLRILCVFAIVLITIGQLQDGPAALTALFSPSGTFWNTAGQPHPLLL